MLLIVEGVRANALHGYTFNFLRDIGFCNHTITIGNCSCFSIKCDITAIYSILHIRVAFAAIASGRRFTGIKLIAALTSLIAAVRMRRFVLRTAVSMLLCDGHVTFILQPRFYILSLMVRTDLVHDAAITHNGIAG